MRLGGSGEGEWSRRVALHEACMGVQVYTILVHVYIGIPIKLFLYESQGGGGGVQANSSGIRI